MIREARETLPVLGETHLVGENGLMCQPGLTPIATINSELKWLNALQGDYFIHCALIVFLYFMEPVDSQLNSIQVGFLVG